MGMKSVLAALCLLAFSASPSSSLADDKPQSSAETAVDRLLGAVGGRDAWAALTGTVNDSQQNRAAEPTVVRAVITMDFAKPRFRIDTRGEGFSTVRVIDGERSWRQTREGVVEDVPDDLYEADMRWYGGHVYRSIHRMAKRDPALAYRLADDGRLEVVENGVRMIWFRLDARGEPYAFGAWEDDAGSLSGPWEFSEGEIRHPIWVSNSTGSWRASVKSLTLDPKIRDRDFNRPARE